MRMLKRIVQSTPIPISGVMLSFSALDTLFQSLEHPVGILRTGETVLCGSIAFLIFLVLTAKLFLCPAQVRGAMDKGNQAAILPTYSHDADESQRVFQAVFGKHFFWCLDRGHSFASGTGDPVHMAFSCEAAVG